MSLISQPGSDYQAARITLDTGNARDIMLMLLDVHAVLDHLHLDASQPQITAPAEDYLRESASPYTLPALISALDEVITMLTSAIRDAGPAISTPARRTPPAAGGARSPRRTPAHAQLRLEPGSEENSGAESA